CTQGLEFPFTF
nr:immunoglobulin light chain junction region [Macaca mulatta]MOW13640.1 immunoglobulin light chain junction region [Macaca mulatta]